MRHLQQIVLVIGIVLSLSSFTFAGTITGSRPTAVGTITGSQVGTITGSKAGTITGSAPTTSSDQSSNTSVEPLTRLMELVIALTW